MTSDSILVSIASLLPDGGWVISMQASFDDGGNGDASITCVAGYFFRDAAIPEFKKEWRSLLGARRFHMVDLVHGQEDFEDLSEPERDALARGLIAAIKQHMTLGVAISVERAAYDAYIGEQENLRKGIGSPFAMCAMLCLASSARWTEHEHIPPEETIYSFESGNSNQADANKFLNMVIKNPSMEERYNYVSHSFVKKNRLASSRCSRLAGMGVDATMQAPKWCGETPGSCFTEKSFRKAPYRRTFRYDKYATSLCTGIAGAVCCSGCWSALR